MCFFVVMCAVFVGCASSVAPTVVPDAAGTDDGAVFGDRPPSTDGASPVCPPRQTFALPATCAGLTELAEHPTSRSALSFALTDLRATRNQHGPACTGGTPWQDRADARVRFTAPRGGLWRFTATGGELWSLDARRDCVTSLACTGYAEVHGPELSTTLTLDVPVQRGESIAVTLDGCPEGGNCAYALRAQWIGTLSCDLSPQTRQVCANESEHCAIDPCDAERFRCVPANRAWPELISARALHERASTRTWFVGQVRVPEGSTRASVTGATLMGRSNDAAQRHFGTGARLGPVVNGVAEFWALYSQTPGGVNPVGLGRAIVWLYDGRPNENHPGLDIPVEIWAPRTVRQRCNQDVFTERCAPGLECSGTEGVGTCLVPGAVEITALRAWRDPLRASLPVEIEVRGVGRHIQTYDIALLDAGGTVLDQRTGITQATAEESPWGVNFRTSFDLAQSYGRAPDGSFSRLSITAAVTRIRVTARDQNNTMSAPREAVVMVPTIVPLGGMCGAASVACDAGLACTERSSTVVSRCVPAQPERLCSLASQVPTWAPQGRGVTLTLEGIAQGIGGIAPCYSGRTPPSTLLEFVAPVTGSYTFVGGNMKAIDVATRCDGRAESSVCVVAPGESLGARATVTLDAGAHVVIKLVGPNNMSGARPFTLSAMVP
jgi:hypothetical protein